MNLHDHVKSLYSKLVGPDDLVRISDGYDSSHDARTDDFEWLASVEWRHESYQYDQTAVFRHKPSGLLFFGEDSGCSCPSPFELTTVEMLTPITRIQDWLDHVNDRLRELREDEEDVRIGRAEDPEYRQFVDLGDLQWKLGSCTDSTYRAFNVISDHFDSYTEVENFTVSLVEKEEDSWI